MLLFVCFFSFVFQKEMFHTCEKKGEQPERSERIVGAQPDNQGCRERAEPSDHVAAGPSHVPHLGILTRKVN